jgi:hypothetical protein
MEPGFSGNSQNYLTDMADAQERTPYSTRQKVPYQTVKARRRQAHAGYAEFGSDFLLKATVE